MSAMRDIYTMVRFRYNFRSADNFDEMVVEIMEFVPRVGDYVMIDGERRVERVVLLPPDPKANTPTLIVFVGLSAADTPHAVVRDAG